MNIDPKSETPPFEVKMEAEDQSYVHIFRDGKIWIGAIERTIALEIVRKLNAFEEQLKENGDLKAQNERLKQTRDRLFGLLNEHKIEIPQ